MNKIVELGLSYHDIAFGKEVMPTLFAKQRENGRAYRFVITDLKGFVSDLSGLTLTMEVGLGTKRQAVEGKNMSAEQDGAFIVEIPMIYDYGRARYSLTITDGEKKLTTKNGRLLIEQSLIFDDGEGGDISFDLVEFQKAMKKLEEELEKQDAILSEIKEMNAETQKLIENHDTDIQAIKDEVDQYSQNAMNEMAESVKEVQNIANRYSLEMSQYSKDIKANTEKTLEEINALVEESKSNVLVVRSIKNELQDVLDKELERQANEEERQNKERGRQDMETLRRADEYTRQENEKKRVGGEAYRDSQEISRRDAEAIRGMNEAKRMSSETERTETFEAWEKLIEEWTALENDRSLSEKDRQEKFAQMEKDFNEMLETLGENPVGELAVEIQKLKKEKADKSEIDTLVEKIEFTGPENKYDLNGDGKVDEKDLRLMTEAIIDDNPDSKYDLNGDGKVSFLDKQILTQYIASQVKCTTTLKNGEEIETYIPSDPRLEEIDNKLDADDLKPIQAELENKADKSELDGKLDKSDIIVIQDGEVEPTLEEGQILIICEVE